MMSNGNKTQVLILDDEPIVCRRLKPNLEKDGYEVETFTQSKDAFERVGQKHFDIVVTDLKMEGLDGMAFLSHVKQHSPDTEVIVITGFATMDTARESFQKGVFDFVAKPFSFSEIRAILKKADDKIRARRQNPA
jgi:DNA-binding NtrC family response regulator